MASQDNINPFTKDKISLHFSNIPTIGTNVKDLSYLYEKFVKRITIPSYTLEFVQSSFRASVINHTVSKNNDELQDLVVDFILDENHENYFNLFQYVQRIRYGEIGQNQSRSRRENSVRQYDIKTLSVHLLDNQRRVQKIIEFNNCFIASLGDLSVEFGTAEQVTFSVTFRYQELFMKDSDVSSAA